MTTLSRSTPLYVHSCYQLLFLDRSQLLAETKYQVHKQVCTLCLFLERSQMEIYSPCRRLLIGWQREHASLAGQGVKLHRPMSLHTQTVCSNEGGQPDQPRQYCTRTPAVREAPTGRRLPTIIHLPSVRTLGSVFILDFLFVHSDIKYHEKFMVEGYCHSRGLATGPPQ